jgi:hypothetical protein
VQWGSRGAGAGKRAVFRGETAILLSEAAAGRRRLQMREHYDDERDGKRQL